MKYTLRQKRRIPEFRILPDKGECFRSRKPEDLLVF
jgi:hypothetical protein